MGETLSHLRTAGGSPPTLRGLGLSRVAGAPAALGGMGQPSRRRLMGRSCEAVVRGPKRSAQCFLAC